MPHFSNIYGIETSVDDVIRHGTSLRPRNWGHEYYDSTWAAKLCFWKFYQQISEMY